MEGCGHHYQENKSLLDFTFHVYMYLAGRARRIINKVERAGLECVYIICDARDAAAEKAAEAAPMRTCCAFSAVEEEKE